MSFKEIQIPVPWGFIAGKCWGNEKDKIIVALHGFQDNANSFDNLIPYLPKSFYYVCLDLPSHGKSSHLQTKGITTVYDFVLALKFVLDHFNQRNYILLAHSFGAQTAIIFTQMYPNRVEKLICLDAGYYRPLDVEMFIDKIREKFQLYSKLHNLSQDTAPAYSLEDAVKKIKDGRPMPITDEAATVILQRALEPAENDKYKFTLAQHLKYMIWPWFTLQYEVKLIKAFPIKCPHLLIMASKTKPFFDYIRDVLTAYKSTNKLFESHVVKGTHDVHMEDPEQVARIINKFLVNNVSKL